MSGLEILGIAAAVVQIAELGGRLSVKLFTFSRKIKSADKSISNVSKDIAATGAVLHQLANILKKDEHMRLCSDQAVETARTLVADCKRIFSELDDALDNKVTGNKFISSWVEKLKFPYIEPQIELLQSNLERLKSSLIVMLNVLVLAEQVRNQEALPILKEQRTLLGILVEDRNTSLKKFDQLQKAIEDSSRLSQPAAINMLSMNREENQLEASPSIKNLEAHQPKREQEIEHHGSLIENLMNEINAGRYKINHGVRFRMHQGVLKAHWDEWSPLRKLYGDSRLMQIVSLHSEVNQYWLSKLEAESTIRQPQVTHPVILPPPPERQRYKDLTVPPPPPPPPNTHPYSAPLTAGSRPQYLPPPPPSNSEPIVSATFMPDGSSFGPGVGIPLLDSHENSSGHDRDSRFRQGYMSTEASRSSFSSTALPGNRSAAHAYIPRPPDSQMAVRASPIEPHNKAQQTDNVVRPAVVGLNHSSPSQASRWPLDRVLAWLSAHGFSSQWQETIRTLGVEGDSFLRLGTARGTGTMHQTIYPSLAKSYTSSSLLWNQSHEREEGKRLRRLISQLAEEKSLDSGPSRDQTRRASAGRELTAGRVPETRTNLVDVGHPEPTFVENKVAFGPSIIHDSTNSDSDSDSGLFALAPVTRSSRTATEAATKYRPSLSLAGELATSAPRSSVRPAEDKPLKISSRDQLTYETRSFGSDQAIGPSVPDIIDRLDSSFPQVDLDTPFDLNDGNGAPSSIASTGRGLVVKRKELIGRSKDQQDDAWIQLTRTSETLKKLKHPHIVQHLGLEHSGNMHNMCYEYVSGGSIGSMLRQDGKLEETVVRSMTSQVLDGLAYLHRNNVVHGNLKADTVLVDLEGSCKLSDFGLSTQELKDLLRVGPAEVSIESVFWMAPERLQPQNQATSKADIWSLGCVVLEMLSGRRPWSTSVADEVKEQLLRGRSPPLQDEVVSKASVDVLNFMYSCFEIDVHERPSAEMLLQSSSFCLAEPSSQVRNADLSTSPFSSHTGTLRRPHDMRTKRRRSALKFSQEDADIKPSDSTSSARADNRSTSTSDSNRPGGRVLPTGHTLVDDDDEDHETLTEEIPGIWNEHGSSPEPSSNDIDALLLEWTTLSADELKQ